MSIISDDLFAVKMKQLQALKREINQDREELYKVMGEWLANALGDDNNHELQAIFLDNHDNPKYLRLKKHRDLLGTVANKLNKLESETKVVSSGFTPPQNIESNQDNLLFDNESEDKSV